jgi:hypothetical protein
MRCPENREQGKKCKCIMVAHADANPRCSPAPRSSQAHPRSSPHTWVARQEWCGLRRSANPSRLLGRAQSGMIKRTSQCGGHSHRWSLGLQPTRAGLQPRFPTESQSHVRAMYVCSGSGGSFQVAAFRWPLVVNACPQVPPPCLPLTGGLRLSGSHNQLAWAAGRHARCQKHSHSIRYQYQMDACLDLVACPIQEGLVGV